jgi:hypothetical protein
VGEVAHGALECASVGSRIAWLWPSGQFRGDWLRPDGKRGPTCRPAGSGPTVPGWCWPGRVQSHPRCRRAGLGVPRQGDGHHRRSPNWRARRCKGLNGRCIRRGHGRGLNRAACDRGGDGNRISPDGHGQPAWHGAWREMRSTRCAGGAGGGRGEGHSRTHGGWGCQERTGSCPVT